MDLLKLQERFKPDDIEWRIGQAGKNEKGIWAKAFAYITNRAIMDRLDEVCGPGNWKNEYAKGPEGGILCGISIKVESEWVTKWDGAENTDVEAVKGGLSNAMKRAAVQWGIGRYLYDLEEGWVAVSDKGRFYAPYSKKSDLPAFKWDPPALPAWALPGKRPVAFSGSAPAASKEEIDKIVQLARDTNTDLNKLYAHYGVGAPTAEKAPKMIADLELKLSKQIDAATKANS